MGLVQRAVSVMMYGNGTAKQVGDNDGQILSLLLVIVLTGFTNMQPLCICLSYQRTMDIVKLLLRITTLKFAFG